MCGIAGVVGERATATDVQRMTAALAHRGPDDDQHVVVPGAAFGHRRLAIIDVVNAKQPMGSDDGRWWLTFNGEIYNYRELAPPLAAERPLRTRSDTEVLLRSFMRRDVSCLRDLRGMFAFAAYDVQKRRLVLARDHLGQKPLYYFHDGDRLAFASEIKALLALDPRLRELDPDALHEYLTLRFVSPPRSMFRRIKKLPPAHYLVFQDGKVDVQPYWQLNFTRKHVTSFATAVDELDHHAQDAVRSHLVSDVPVGALLSGGLDSSLIVALMDKVTGRKFPTFTGDVPYENRSEAPYARAVAERYGMPNYTVRVDQTLTRMLPQILWHLDEPADPLALCLYPIAGLARKHVKVVLGGDGGDELFGGYDRYYGNQYADYYALLPAAVRHRLFGPLIARLSGGGWYRSVEHQLKWLQFLSESRGGTRYARSLRYFYVADEHRHALYTPRFRKLASAFDPERALAALYDGGSAREALDRMLLVDYRTRLPDHPLMILDRMTMAHGLEARSPFLDYRLAEYCASLPPRYKVRGLTARRIERALAERYLPKEVLAHKKQGFSSSMPYLLDAEFRSMQAGLFQDSTLVEDGYLSSSGLASLMAEHASGRQDHGQRLWLIGTAELWYRLFLRGEHASSVERALQAVA